MLQVHLVRRREHEEKENGTDEGWPLTATATAIDNPLETLPQSRPCNGIATSVKSVVNELRGGEDLPAVGSSTTHHNRLLEGGVGVDNLLGTGRCNGKEPSDG